MQYLDLLFENCIQPYSIKFKTLKDKSKVLLYRSKKSDLEIIDLQEIMNFLNSVHKSPLKKFPVIIDLYKSLFADKLTYIIFECIIHYAITTLGIKNVKLIINPNNNINTCGLINSPLMELNSAKNSNIDKFENKFHLDLSNFHFRKVLKYSKYKNDNTVTSNIMQDINSYLNINGVNENYANSISEVLTELTDNVLEHAKSDCLIDIDINPNIRKTNNEPNNKQLNSNFTHNDYYMVNVVILNFSNKLTGTELKCKMLKNKDIANLNSRYFDVLNAYENHSKYFCKSYTCSDFFTIASFQDKISGRQNKKLGGRGLTTLLKSLEQEAEAYNCYMLTGNNILWFHKEYLNFNKDNWIGFNKENDFVNNIPSKECFQKIPFFFSGTAYNLAFIVKSN